MPQDPRAGSTPRSEVTDTTTMEHMVTGTQNTLILRPPLVQVAVGALTHPGKVRPNNEDNFLVAKLAKALQICMSSLPSKQLGGTDFSQEEGYLMVVADGMGGAAAGETASALAIEMVEQFVLHALLWFQHNKRSEGQLASELCQAMERADRKVMERARRETRLTGMGTTLTVAYTVGTDLYVVHAGDSRAYLLHDGKLERLTKDDTLVQMLVDAGQISPDQARKSPRRNVVTNVVGGPSQGVTPQIIKRTIGDGDVLLLCSDGLYEPLPNEDKDIERILREVGRTDPQQAAEDLRDIVLDNGARDNLTAVIARYTVEQVPQSLRATIF